MPECSLITHWWINNFMIIHRRKVIKAKRLPEAVKKYMQQRFNLLPEYLNLLGCFKYTDLVNGRQVKRLTIFRCDDTHKTKNIVTNIQDLERHKELLLFEGYIDSNGNVYVADRRSPSHKTRDT